MQEEKEITLDKVNPDQVLTEDEKRACKECFDAYDKLGIFTHFCFLLFETIIC